MMMRGDIGGKNGKIVFLLLLFAVLTLVIFFLMAAVFSAGVFTVKTANALTANDLMEAELTYRLTEAGGDEEAYYTVIGIEREWLLGETERGQKLCVKIPAEYGEGEERHPVKRIAANAFYTGLYACTVAEADFSEAVNLEEIGGNAFSYASITELDLSGATALHTLGATAFGSCRDLLTVHMPGIANLGADVFLFCDSLELIFLPDEAAYNVVNAQKLAAEAANNTELKGKLTYEFEVSFDSENDDVEIPPQLKLYGQSLQYEKTNGKWAINKDYKLPDAGKKEGEVYIWVTFFWGAPMLPTDKMTLDSCFAKWLPLDAIKVTEFTLPEGCAVYTSTEIEDLRPYITARYIIYGMESFIFEDYTISLPDGQTALSGGENTVEIGLNGFTAEFKVEAVKVTPLAVRIDGDYSAFSALRPKDSCVCATFNDGSEAVIDDFTAEYGGGLAYFTAGEEQAATLTFQWQGEEYTLTATADIAKIDYDMSGVTFSDRVYKFTRKGIAPKISGDLPAGVSVVYDVTELKEVGEYTVTAHFISEDTVNYNPISPFTARLTVKRNLDWLIITASVTGGALLVTAAVFFALTRYKKATALQLAEDFGAGKFQQLPSNFTKMEREISELVFQGKTRKEIARQLFISDNTVKFHISNILRKTESATRIEFIAKYRSDDES